MRKLRPKATGAIAACAALAMVVTGCAADPGSSKNNEETPFTFAGAGDPTSLDPSLASDGETFRVTRQVFETLLKHEDGGTEIVGGLAETWEQSEDGRQWSFKLRDGVTFHNGEELTAETVCSNYDRWYNWSGQYQLPSLSTYWQDNFGGFAENEADSTPESNYVGCTPDGLDLTIEVKEPSSRFPGAFTLASMAIHSQESIDAYAEQQPEGEGEAMTYPEYTQKVGDAHGTGPYKYKEWDHANHEVVLERYDDYWNEDAAGNVKTLIFKTISKENDRKQALLAGDIDGYDLVAPQDIGELKDADMQVPTRDPFNLMYLATNQKTDGEANIFANKEARQAVAHGVNKEKLIKQIYPPGAEAATQFQPPTLDGWSEDVPTYEYDVEKAKSLLADFSDEEKTIDFCYPTDVTRPYMPAPDSIFQNLKADLEKIGFTIEDKPLTWAPDYTDDTSNGKCTAYILGWTGDYNEAYNFLGTWFANENAAWGFNNEDIFAKLDEIDKEPDPENRVGMYQEANEMIMEFIPGVPMTHSSPSIAFAPYVTPPTTSPLTMENFAEVSFK